MICNIVEGEPYLSNSERIQCMTQPKLSTTRQKYRLPTEHEPLKAIEDNNTASAAEMLATMSAASEIFELGKHSVDLLNIESSSRSAPPKPLLIAAPRDEGDFPVLVLLHGYLLFNSFYSQLVRHVASHGFVIVAPQLYSVAGPDSQEEIKSAAEITDWLIDGLVHVLPRGVQPNLCKLALAGHSRGGKVAFALALGYAKTSLKFSALIGIDPVDGMGMGKQTNPPILTYQPRSFDLKMAALVIGSGLGELKKNAFFPACAPKGVSHQEFFDECRSPASHFVAKDYGHLDMLDDETRGLRGKGTYCLCKNGKARKPMRDFVGGVMVAFMKGFLEGDMKDLLLLGENPEISPIDISVEIME